MGLLDDAIREHLELKRLRGADPSDVARLEREALGAGRRGAASPEELAPEEAHAPPPFDAEHAAEAPLTDDSLTLIPGSEPSTLGQDTAELDMESVIGADPDEHLTTEHSVEHYEAEATRVPEPPEQDRPEPLAPPAAAQTEPEHVEDVLEETPDFLEQTPEHDRLWFEQQPPRDFDFDK